MRLSRSRLLLVFAVAALAAAAIVTSCGRSAVGAPSKTTPVILISIDTLRSDHLPAYGYTGVATPAIDALRKDSILYERAYSQVPLTLPSHSTILTGMLPADHGVRDNVGFQLPASVPTVQELLKRNGYATGASVSAFVLRKETGISRGFDFFDDDVQPLESRNSNLPTVIGRVQREGQETLNAARQWVEAHAGQPFFFFLHLYDPHTPYTPPEPYFSRYPNHYDGEIAYADSVVGDLIADLKARGVYDNALIILLSDHGEGLNDHGEEEHGLFLYREALQIPLLVKLPKGRKGGATVKTPVELVDVFPTILDRTATPMPASGHRIGQSLLSFLGDSGPTRQIYAETYYPKFHFGWSDLHSLIDGNDHYIRAPKAELYDLASDPAEKNNTLESNRRAYTKMRAAIEPFVQKATAPTNIDPEEAAKLAALGYVGSTVSTKEGEALADPKDMLGTFRDIRIAFTEYRDGNEDKALAMTNELLKTNQMNEDVWHLKATVLAKMGRRAEAEETAKEGLRHAPGAVSLLFDVANFAFDAGDLKTAEQHADLAVKLEPGEAHQILARIALRRNDVPKAQAEAKAAIETSHDPVPMLMMLATIAKAKGDLTGALGYMDRAEERVSHRKPPQLADLHLNRGDVLARLGRNEEAEREFRSEIADFPKTSEAYASLIMLLATQRRLDEATRLVFDFVKAVPEAHSYAVIAETLKAIGDDNGAMFWIAQGLQHYPGNPELRAMPARLREVTPILRKQLTN
jgi:arylsulfatase A-like enzyme/Tfp pilus assembly protein PilF